MRLLDRYIIRLFLLNFVILFVVMVSLVLLVELIANFDEFVQAAQRQASSGTFTEQTANTLRIIADFYGPMLFLYYDYFVGVLPVGAAAFTLASLSRNRELTAMLAGGVSMHRIALPIIAMGVFANVLMAANQEFALPYFAQKLSRSRADIKLGHVRPMAVRFVPDSAGMLFSAATFNVEQQTMQDVTILRRRQQAEGIYGRTIERITAEKAEWDEQQHGWRLTDAVRQSRETTATASAGPATGPGADEAAPTLVKTDLSPIALLMKEKARVRQLLSMGQLSELIESSHTLNISELQRIRHTRFSLPVVNLLILVMGTSFFLLRTPGNLLLQTVKAAPLVIGAWAGGFIMLQISPTTLLPAAAVAWLPVAIYLPQAYYLWESVES